MTDLTSRPPDGTDLAALARDAGLRRIGGRPRLGEYVGLIWQRRHFAVAFARAKAYSRHQRGYLGQLWNVLTPLLWTVLYLLVFGVVLDLGDGVTNYPVYLVAGLFFFRFVSQAMGQAAGCLARNSSLMASLRFPRALIPLSVAIGELLAFLPALGVLLVVAVVSGEPVTAHLLLVVPAVALTTVFTAGLCLVTARLVDQVADLKNLVPFVSRALLYTSGVFFALDRYDDPTVRTIMEHQPWAVYLHLGRSAVMESVPVDPTLWAWGVGWAALALGVGLVAFWRAEDRYGRG